MSQDAKEKARAILEVSDPTCKHGGMLRQAPKLTSPLACRQARSRSHGMDRHSRRDASSSGLCGLSLKGEMEFKSRCGRQAKETHGEPGRGRPYLSRERGSVRSRRVWSYVFCLRGRPGAAAAASDPSRLRPLALVAWEGGGPASGALYPDPKTEVPGGST